MYSAASVARRWVATRSRVVGGGAVGVAAGRGAMVPAGGAVLADAAPVVRAGAGATGLATQPERARARPSTALPSLATGRRDRSTSSLPPTRRRAAGLLRRRR